MKKIPTLFERVFKDHKIVDITDKITPGCEEAFLNGKATIKFDGICCAVFDGVPYKRYDAKKGRKPPEGAIPCCDPDPITGHWPHWIKINPDDPSDKWIWKAFNFSDEEHQDGTYEAVGPHFQGNPYGLCNDFFMPHGTIEVFVQRDFNFIRSYLANHDIEGLVFWLNGEPVCKIKRSDFGLEWPIK